MWNIIMEESDYAKTISVLKWASALQAVTKSSWICLSGCNESLKFEKTKKEINKDKLHRVVPDGTNNSDCIDSTNIGVERINH